MVDVVVKGILNLSIILNTTARDSIAIKRERSRFFLGKI